MTYKYLQITFYFILFLSCNSVDSYKEKSVKNQIKITDEDTSTHDCVFLKLINESCLKEYKEKSVYLLFTMRFPYTDSSLIFSVKEINNSFWGSIKKFHPFENDVLFNKFNNSTPINCTDSIFFIPQDRIEELLAMVNGLSILKTEEHYKMENKLTSVYDGIIISLDIAYKGNKYSGISLATKADSLNQLYKYLLTISNQHPRPYYKEIQ